MADQNQSQATAQDNLTQPAAQEKRRYERFQNYSLRVDVARPGIKGIIRTNPTADCLNFSRTGLQFDCPQKLKQGEPLLIDIAVDEIELQDLSAKVVSGRDNGNGSWCYGVRFCLESPKMRKGNVYHCLLMIEEKLKIQSAFPYTES